MNSSYLYTGSPINPRFTLNIGDKHLERGKDFDVEIYDNVNVGTAHVLIKGKGRFKGIIERSFEITPVPARSLSFFADNTEFDYTGEPCIMQVAVKFGEKTLEEGVDYTVEYIDNVSPGKATARITFKGNFSGIMKIPFVINGDADEETEELVNLSEISASDIKLGESVVVTSAAQGGKGEYSYAVFYKKAESKKWVTVHGYRSDKETPIKPLNPVLYNVCIKAKDEEGTIAKKYFDVRVERTAQV